MIRGTMKKEGKLKTVPLDWNEEYFTNSGNQKDWITNNTY